MSLVERTWMTLVLLFMVLSSVKIKVNQQYGLHQVSQQHATNLDISVFGANAMAMSFSMQMPPFMPIPMPPMPMPSMAMPIPIPVKIPIIDLQQQKQQAQTYTPQQQPQQTISGCHCSSYNQQQQQPQPGCPPCPFVNQNQQPQIGCQPCPYINQQQQLQAGCPPCPYPQQQQQQQQQQCCQNNQNNYAPSQIPQIRPSCVICRPGQSPQQPGHNGMVPVAQVVLTPVINRNRKKCDSNESDDRDDDDSEDSDKDSEETDGCARRCRKRLARMKAERRNSQRKHRRMNKRRFSKRDLLDIYDDQRKGSVRPVLQYVARNGDIKYKTKISDDEAFELLGDNSVNSDRTIQTKAFRNDEQSINNKAISLRKTFSNDDNAQSKIRLMRAGDPIVLRNKVQHQILNPGKKELVFQSPKGNEITNLSLTFLFS